jgi:glutamate-ammonia-ligase adenylyltransferase
VRVVTRELADVAEAIVSQVARDQWHQRAARYGTPRCADDGRRDRWAIVALGKFGGRELNYHSDLDLIFLHEADGRTAGGPASISNDQFVTEVVQRVLKSLGGGPAAGPLYSVDARLRPHGASGPLVLTLGAFGEYLDRSTQTWERMAFTRARVIFATGGFGTKVTEAIKAVLAAPVEPGPLAAQVLAMRRRLEASRPRHHLKRGFGGVADIEFIVQYLQLAHAAQQPDLLRPNLWDALDAMRRHGFLETQTHAELRDAYDFLRAVEGRLRLIQNRNVGELPQSPIELERLARRLNDESAGRDGRVATFLADLDAVTRRTRDHFDRIITAAAVPSERR